MSQRVVPVPPMMTGQHLLRTALLPARSEWNSFPRASRYANPFSSSKGNWVPVNCKRSKVMRSPWRQALLFSPEIVWIRIELPMWVTHRDRTSRRNPRIFQGNCIVNTWKSKDNSWLCNLEQAYRNNSNIFHPEVCNFFRKNLFTAGLIEKSGKELEKTEE